MSVLINFFGESWYEKLKPYLDSKEFNDLGLFLQGERKSKTIYPETKDMFKAFSLTPFNKVSVVILGQDPYSNGEADGLAFSVKEDPYIVKQPPSLKAIFDEVEADVYAGFKVEQDWSLARWAEQGVLLLNTALSVEKNKPKSHAYIGWNKLITSAISSLSADTNNKKVFLLWGGDAKGYERYIDKETHLVLKSGHPATKYYDIDYWTGNKHFSQTNRFLKQQNKPTIIW